MLVGYIYPSGWRNTNSIVTKINKNIYAIPVHKSIRIRGFTFLIVALGVFLLTNTCWYIMTDTYFCVSLFFRSKRNTGFAVSMALWIPTSKLV